MIVLVDNYDSFVHNLARYLQLLGQETRLIRNDAASAAQIGQWAPAAIVLSPGPCTPAEAGCSIDVIRQLGGKVPILGVCLGHQAIGAALGARIVRAPQPMHGRTSPVYHQGAGLFAGLPSPFIAGRYHSLVIEEVSLPADLQITARSEEGVIMGIQHCHWPLYGVQFHPESVLTDHGFALLVNFLALAGIAATNPVPEMLSERPTAATVEPLPHLPVTF